MEKKNGNGHGHPKSYSRFQTKDIKNLGITIRQASLFSSVQPIQPTALLLDALEHQVSIKLDSEKAKSEFIIAPIIREIIRQNTQKIAVFSGYSFEVDAEKGLTGACDYIFTSDPTMESIEAPIFFLVEAKNESIITGIPQCIAEMYAAQIVNTAAGLPPKPIYGAITFGREWQFFRLDGQVATRDTSVYPLVQLPEILGILQAIVDQA